ncbi:MAG: AAA family ATPase [Patescibacteria group bacterium]
MNLVFLGGVSGVGKTSVAREFAKESLVHVLDGSAELMKWLGITDGDYDRLRSLPEKVKEKALTDLFRTLAGEDNHETTIVTGHYVKVLNGKITSSYGPWYQHCITLVLVVGNPKLIVRRILCDEVSKKRTNRSLFGNKQASLQEQIDFIKDAQLRSTEVMAKAAKTFGVLSHRIENIEGGLQNSSRQLSQIIIRRL